MNHFKMLFVNSVNYMYC